MSEDRDPVGPMDPRLREETRRGGGDLSFSGENEVPAFQRAHPERRQQLTMPMEGPEPHLLCGILEVLHVLSSHWGQDSSMGSW